jgi:hypothetical protein
VEIHKKSISHNIEERREAVRLLGFHFSNQSDKDQAWKDLHRLTQDGDRGVRTDAYHSLGRASVFKATEAEDKGTLKSELAAAVAYFEKSSQESQYSPASF